MGKSYRQWAATHCTHVDNVEELVQSQEDKPQTHRTFMRQQDRLASIIPVYIE